MSSAGHVLDMIKRMKANRPLLKPKRRRHSKIKAMYRNAGYGGKATNPLDNLPEEELSKIRNDIRKKLALERKRGNIIVAIAGVLLLGFAVWLLYWVFNG